MTSVSPHPKTSRPASSIFWFTLLCSLLGALWALNIFPQGPLSFRIQTTVVLNSSRLDRLEQILAQGIGESPSTDCVYMKVAACEELSSTADKDPVQALTQSDLPKLYRVTLDSNWKKRIPVRELRDWISELTEPSAKGLTQSTAASELRWTEFKIDLAQQYKAADENRVSWNLDTNISVRAASYTPGNSSSQSTTPPTSSAPMLNVASLQKREVALRSQLDTEHKRLMGTASIIAISQWSPIVTSDPLLAPILGLLLGALSGVTIAVFSRKKRVINQGFHATSRYRETLQELGIPLFHIAEQSEGTISSTEVNSTKDHLSWWINGCEWSLLFWIAAVGVRFAFDPIWRDISISQPLLALARLFTVI